MSFRDRTTKLDNNCWKELTSEKKNKYYFFNVEKGVSQWNFPNSLNHLPIDWKQYKSKTAESYYYVNDITGVTTWDKPSGDQYLTPEEIIVKGWKTKKSKCGNVYYINNSNGTTTWEIPTKKSVGVHHQEEMKSKQEEEEEERIRLHKQEEERIRKQEEEERKRKQEEEERKRKQKEEDRKRKEETGIVYEVYYTKEKYRKPMYSDHAPILYPINPHLNIITWNVAQYGNAEFYNTQSKSTSYNHKFHMSRVETEDEYKHRLQNIVDAIYNLFSLGKTYIKADPDPLVFLQELPNFHGNPKFTDSLKQLEFKILFNKLLTKKGLINISFNDKPITIKNNSEFGLIVREGNPKQITYSPYFTSKIKDLIRCEVYFTKFKGRSIVYVNLHIPYDKGDFKTNISRNLTRATQELFKVIDPKPLIIYFIGDFNSDIFGDDDIVIKKMKELFRGVMPIKNIEKYTTPENKAYSLRDNSGNENPENIDGIIKVEFE